MSTDGGKCIKEVGVQDARGLKSFACVALLCIINGLVIFQRNIDPGFIFLVGFYKVVTQDSGIRQKKQRVARQ